jgi:DNA-binding transcriptional ArsR family regulator
MKKPRTRLEAANACVGLLDAEFFRALCEPARIQIFKQLVLKGRSDIGTIAEDLPQDRSVIARHLQTMQRAGVLRTQSEGRHTYYEIDGANMIERTGQLHALTQLLVPLCCPE